MKKTASGWLCLGITEEAAQLTLEKMANGPHRFPAFWGPGYYWILL